MAEHIPAAIGVAAIIIGAVFMIATRPKKPRSGTNHDHKGGYEWADSQAADWTSAGYRPWAGCRPAP